MVEKVLRVFLMKAVSDIAVMRDRFKVCVNSEN